MPACATCSAEIAENARFCSSCGSPADISSAGTMEMRPGSRPPSSSGIDHGRFLPGTMFGSRYRIVAILGKGGMGEVYRADDLKLGQPVALKLLPKQFGSSPERHARLLGEVRIARQIGHPNVCRVYDVGELEGEHFITMEYVHGEDLASLLHRIGRLSKDKGIEIARQICAGLAAAHERGILHRDLKPANIMLDERGKVRVTDFGLAAAADDVGGKVAEGTPAYMAPEQLAGREVTVRSDIYSLGLVLYEIFTGKRAFSASTLAELREMREQKSLTDPSRIVEDIDPAVERVILRCLENDPRDRPPSVLAVAAALPGGDPLAAALAAGETPSPELLAAAGDSVGLKPSVAIPLLLFVLLGTVAAILLRARNELTAYVDLDLPPDALELKARETIRQLGYQQKFADSARGFYTDRDLLRYIADHDKSPQRWERLRKGQPPSLLFWYRESHEPLEWINFFGGEVTRSDPPPLRSGMKQATLDPAGRLVFFRLVPEQIESAPAAAVDWHVLFAAAGLDLSRFKPVAPKWVPPTFADSRAAWEGSYPTGETMRVEAAAYHGRPVYFELIGPWTRPTQMEPVPVKKGQKIAQGIVVTLFVAILLGGILIARRNVSLGRGDRRGAARLAIATFLIWLAGGVLSTTHAATTYELGIMVMLISFALFVAGLLWLLYLALEPYVRRRWPHALIALGKVLSGRLRDPLVGRDVLIGSAAGIALELVFCLMLLITRAAGGVVPTPAGSFQHLFDIRHAFGNCLGSAVASLFLALVATFLLFMLRILLRKEWLAFAALLLIGALLAVLQADNPIIAGIGNLIAWAVVLLVMMRFGFVATFFLFFVWNMIVGPTSFTAWHSYTVWIPLTVIAATSIAAFYASLAGRPLFREALLET